MGGAASTYGKIKALESELQEIQDEQAAQLERDAKKIEDEAAAERRAKAKVDRPALRAADAQLRKLHKAGVLWGAWRIPATSKILKRWFVAANGTCTHGRCLSFRSFKWALEATGDRNLERISASFAVIDADENGHVDFHEFAERIPAYYEELYRKPPPPPPRWVPTVLKAPPKGHVPEHVKMARRNRRTLHAIHHT